MNLYIVSFGSHIAGSHDHVYVMSKNEYEALKIGKPKLDTHKLFPDFLNRCGRFSVSKVQNPQSILPFINVYYE